MLTHTVGQHQSIKCQRFCCAVNTVVSIPVKDTSGDILYLTNPMKRPKPAMKYVYCVYVLLFCAVDLHCSSRTTWALNVC